MFTMAKIRDLRFTAKSNHYLVHLEAGDYINPNEKVIGIWKGSLAEKFGILDKQIIGSDENFLKLWENINPFTGKKFNSYSRREIKYFDFQCAARKSASIMGVLLEDDRVIKAHENALLDTLPEIEKLVFFNANDGSKKNTGNCSFALFRHKFSRAGDPHIHTHVVVPNITYDTESNTYRSIETLYIHKGIKYLGLVYKTKFGENLVNAGYSICEAKNSLNEVDGFEIRGISTSILSKFQERKDAINNHIKLFEKEKGRKADICSVSRMEKISRSRKMFPSSENELINRGLSKLFKEDFDALNNLKKTSLTATNIANKKHKIEETEIKELIEVSFLYNFVKKPEVSQHEILYDLLRWTIQNSNYVQIEQVFNSHCHSIESVGVNKGKLTSYVSQKTVTSETNIISVLNRKMHFEKPILYKMANLKKSTIPEIRAITKSHDQFILVKTTSSIEFIKFLRNVNGYFGVNNDLTLARVVFSKNAENYDIPINTVLPNRIHQILATDLLILDISKINNISVLEGIISKISKTNAKVLVCNNRDRRRTSNIAILIENYSKIRKIYIGCRSPKKLLAGNRSIKKETDPIKMFHALNVLGKIIKNQSKYKEKAFAEVIKELAEPNSSANAYLVVSKEAKKEDTKKIRDALKLQKVLGGEKGFESLQSNKMNLSRFKELKKDYEEKDIQLYVEKNIKVIGSVVKKGTIIERKHIIKFTEDKLLLSLSGEGINIPLRKHADKISLLKYSNVKLCKNERIKVNGNSYVVKKIEGQTIVCQQGEKLKTINMSTLSNLPEYDYVKITSESKHSLNNSKLILAAEKIKATTLLKLVKNSDDIKIFTPSKTMLQWNLNRETGFDNHPFLRKNYRYEKYYPFITKSYLESISRMNRKPPPLLPESVLNEYAMQEAAPVASRMEITETNRTNIKINQEEGKNNEHIIRSI